MSFGLGWKSDWEIEMPTYRNDGNAAQKVTNTDGRTVSVFPGGIVQTYYMFADDGDPWKKISNEPYYNHVLALTQPTGSEDVTINLKSNTDRIEIYNVSSYSVSVYLNFKENTPARVVPSGSVVKIPERSDEPSIKNKVSSLVLGFDGSISSGQVKVSEFKDQKGI